MIKKKRERKKPYVVARQCGERPARKCVCVPSHKHILLYTKPRFDNGPGRTSKIYIIVQLCPLSSPFHTAVCTISNFIALLPPPPPSLYICIRAAINQKLVQLRRIPTFPDYPESLCPMRRGWLK